MDELTLSILFGIWSVVNLLCTAWLYREHKRLAEMKRIAEVWQKLTKPSDRRRL
jgi:hypothetical protein